MRHAHYLSLTALLISALVPFAGCATKHPMRPTAGPPGDPTSNIPIGKRWYIQSQPVKGLLPYSCSFVEFDERGDYLDLGQQQRSWQKIKELASTNKLIVIIYCHGWKNDAQSGNVIDFNRALAKLAATPGVKTNNIRVHGLYLAWRGNEMKPFVDRKSDAFRTTEHDFGAPIVNQPDSRFFDWFTPSWIIELTSYWSRKKAAEYRVSGVPLARTIFTAANAAKHFSSATDWTNHVFVVGHSFGALMLERSLGQACVGTLTQWKGTDTNTTTGLPASVSKLPFDAIVFVNSAAPSIHTKELADLLSGHKRVRGVEDSAATEGPVILSITSDADWATGVAHPVANAFAPFYPSLQRKYTEGVLVPATNLPAVEVPQSYFYSHTPGHNPLLVNHWIKQVYQKKYPDFPFPANNEEDVLTANLRSDSGHSEIFFTTSSAKRATNALAWQISTDSYPEGWSKYKRHDPVSHAHYWIIRCGGSLIANHDAIWTLTALNMYAGLYRYAHGQAPRP